MQSFFDNLRANRSVLKRTRPNPELPDLVLYTEWLAGEAKRKVRDTRGLEHAIADGVLASSYRLVTGSQAKELIEAHWANLVPPVPQPIVIQRAPEAPPAAAARPASQARPASAPAADTKPAKHTAAAKPKKATAKKPAAKRSAKAASARKAPAKSAAKKPAAKATARRTAGRAKH